MKQINKDVYTLQNHHKCKGENNQRRKIQNITGESILVHWTAVREYHRLGDI